MTRPEQNRGLRRLRRLTAALAHTGSHPEPYRRLAQRFSPPPANPNAIAAQLPAKLPGQLRLLTLNVAHGRRHFPHQALMRRRTTRHHLMQIAGALSELDPDVAALQEADGPSPWSGNIDHVETLAWLANLGDFYRGDHNPFRVGRFQLASGTALLTRQPLIEPRSFRFASTWRDTKGFVVATVRVPEWDQRPLDVVSVHLDFLNRAVRRRQVLQMIETLEGRNNPLVILGDLNCCWQREPETLGPLIERLGLRAHEPDAEAPTYPSYSPRRRLDWILISPELAFAGHHTVEAPLSDHLVVVADLRAQ